MQHTREHDQAESSAPYVTVRLTPGVVERVRAALVHALTQGESGNPLLLRRVARRLGMSSRTLQRRLLAANTGFSELLRETREQLAVRALSSDQTVSEIAELLAFSDTSAFTRAFKRWTGMSPTRFRCSILARRAHRARSLRGD